jgi:hypothetical protein
VVILRSAFFEVRDMDSHDSANILVLPDDWQPVLLGHTVGFLHGDINPDAAILIIEIILLRFSIGK